VHLFRTLSTAHASSEPMADRHADIDLLRDYTGIGVHADSLLAEQAAVRCCTEDSEQPSCWQSD